MNYSAPRLLEIFGVGKHSARVTKAEAAQLAHHPEAIAERVYGLGNPKKAKELGNTQPGDGFLYRGNGVLQTTGRGAHRRMGEAFGVDFEGNPNLVTAPEHALKPALQEWTEGNLNVFADKNDIRTITLRINGGLSGFAERKAFFKKLLPLLNSDG
jgi:putative chitinase